MAYMCIYDRCVIKSLAFGYDIYANGLSLVDVWFITFKISTQRIYGIENFLRSTLLYHFIVVCHYMTIKREILSYFF